MAFNVVLVDRAYQCCRYKEYHRSGRGNYPEPTRPLCKPARDSPWSALEYTRLFSTASQTYLDFTETAAHALVSVAINKEMPDATWNRSGILAIQGNR